MFGGFSQGAVMSYALGLAAGRPRPAGILAMSGFIPTVGRIRARPREPRGPARLHLARHLRPGHRRRVRPRGPRSARRGGSGRHLPRGPGGAPDRPGASSRPAVLASLLELARPGWTAHGPQTTTRSACAPWPPQSCDELPRAVAADEISSARRRRAMPVTPSVRRASTPSSGARRRARSRAARAT